MKAISLWQPWATLVALKLKTIETRGHDRFRNLSGQRIAIHATQKWNEDGLLVSRILDSGRLTHGFALITSFNNIEMWAARCKGKIVCTAVVEDVQWARDVVTQWVDLERRALCAVQDKCLLFLTDIQPLRDPIPFQGRQGIFNVPDELILSASAGSSELRRAGVRKEELSLAEAQRTQGNDNKGRVTDGR